jgi:hypothetical protein
MQFSETRIAATQSAAFNDRCRDAEAAQNAGDYRIPGVREAMLRAWSHRVRRTAFDALAQRSDRSIASDRLQ